MTITWSTGVIITRPSHLVPFYFTFRKCFMIQSELKKTLKMSNLRQRIFLLLFTNRTGIQCDYQVTSYKMESSRETVLGVCIIRLTKKSSKKRIQFFFTTTDPTCQSNHRNPRYWNSLIEQLGKYLSSNLCESRECRVLSQF